MIFDGEQLSDLMAPLDLGWKARTQAELALMADLKKRATGRDISGLSARTRPHGRPAPPPHQTRRWPRHLRTQRV
jgi:hypothetical protein